MMFLTLTPMNQFSSVWRMAVGPGRSFGLRHFGRFIGIGQLGALLWCRTFEGLFFGNYRLYHKYSLFHPRKKNALNFFSTQWIQLPSVWWTGVGNNILPNSYLCVIFRKHVRCQHCFALHHDTKAIPQRLLCIQNYVKLRWWNDLHTIYFLFVRIHITTICGDIAITVWITKNICQIYINISVQIFRRGKLLT